MFDDIFTLKGRWNRLNRMRYFGYMLLINILVMALVFGLIALGVMDLNAIAEGGFPLPYIAILALSIWPSICVAVKRLHDLDKPGWLFLLAFVPIINFFFGIYMLFFRGTDGENQFGPDPLAQA